MALTEQTTKPQDYMVSEEADRKLLRVMMIYGIPCFVLLLGSMFGCTYLSMVWPHHQGFINMLSAASMLVLLPIFYAMNFKIYAIRLDMGRTFVEKQQWREAVAALDPFSQFMQRWLDRTGEAHYLLAKAYAGMGNKVKAAAARKFVIDKRPGVWADRLAPAPAPRASKVTRRDSIEALDKRPRPAKAKPRRRF